MYERINGSRRLAPLAWTAFAAILACLTNGRASEAQAPAAARRAATGDKAVADESSADRQIVKILERAMEASAATIHRFERGRNYCDLALAQAQFGRRQEARATLLRVLEQEDQVLRRMSGDSKDSRLLTIGEGLALIGDLQQAIQIVNDRVAPMNRESGFQRVAYACVRNGDMHSARAIRELLSEEGRKQIDIMIQAAAERSVATAKNDTPMGKCYAAIDAARRLAAHGDKKQARQLLGDALDLANKLEDAPGVFVRSMALANVTGARAGIGDVSDALDWTEAQTDADLRAKAYIRMAQGLIQESPYRGKVVLIGARPATHREVLPGVVMAMRPDGSELETVVSFPGADIVDGRLSPDGRWLVLTVFERSQNQNLTLWLVGPDGKRSELLSQASIQAWSPDGKQLLGQRNDGERVQSVVIDVESGAERPVDLPAGDVAECWTRDGERLMVVASNPDRIIDTPRGQYPKRSLYTVDLEGKNRREFTAEAEFDQLESSLSPDGQWVAHFRRENPDVHRVRHFGVVRRADGSRPRVVTDFEEQIESLDPGHDGEPVGPPCWSADGRHLLWVVEHFYRQATTPSVQPDSPFFYDLSYTDLYFIDPDMGFERRLELESLGLVYVSEIAWP